MAFAKGHKKHGGRKRGSVNKITTDIAFALAQVGCDPIMGMAKIAMDAKTDINLKARMFAELAQYQYPKRRAIEVTPGKTDATGARLVPLDVLLVEYHYAREGK